MSRWCFSDMALTNPASVEPPGNSGRSTEAVCGAKWELSVLLIMYARKESLY